MSSNRNVGSSCNKKNYKNNLNKIVKNSINSKKYLISSKLRSGNNVGNKEIHEVNSFEKLPKKYRNPSYSDVRKPRSKSKIIVRNVQRTNNIIDEFEKLIKQNVDVERGAKKIKCNNFNLFSPLYKKLKKYEEITPKINKKYQKPEIEQNKKLSSLEETPRKHDSIQEIMFSHSFKERSDSSRLEQERDKLLHLLTKENNNNLTKTIQSSKNSTSKENYFDCTVASSSTNEFHSEGHCPQQNSFDADPNDKENLLKRKNSSKMLVHFKDLLNQYLKKNSTGETKFFLSKEDIDCLRSIVEADEKYHKLRMEDHVLLKEILLSQLEEIQMHQSIVDNILKTLKVNNSSEQKGGKKYSSSSLKSEGKCVSKSKLVPEKSIKNCKRSPSNDSCCHISAVDAQEPSSFIREKCSSADFNISDEISWASSSQEQLSQLLDNEDGEKLQLLLQELIRNANKTDVSCTNALIGNINANQQHSEALDDITERTEPVLNSLCSETTYYIEKKSKKIGVELKKTYFENYIAIENLPPCITVYPLHMVTAIYPALEFTKKSMSLETLKNTKEVYIPKKGSKFELEKVDYEHLMSNPEKLKRVLKTCEKKKQNSILSNSNAVIESNEMIPKTRSSVKLQQNDVGRIGLAVTLFESYSYILQNIEELNQFIRNNAQCCHDIAKQSKPNERGDNIIIHQSNEIVDVGCRRISSGDFINDIENFEGCDLMNATIKVESTKLLLSEFFDVEADNVVENIFLSVREIPIPIHDSYEFVEEELISNTKLSESPSKIINFIRKNKITLLKNGLVFFFESTLFALVVSALLLQEPVCQ